MSFAKIHGVVQKAQKQQNCELTQSSSVVSGQGLWEAYLPGTREGCHSKEEVLHRYRKRFACIFIHWSEKALRHAETKSVFVLRVDQMTRKYMQMLKRLKRLCTGDTHTHRSYLKITFLSKIMNNQIHECVSSEISCLLPLKTSQY